MKRDFLSFVRTYVGDMIRPAPYHAEAIAMLEREDVSSLSFPPGKLVVLGPGERISYRPARPRFGFYRRRTLRRAAR